MKKIIRAWFALIAFGFLSPALALQGESIVFNPATGNYLITYKDKVKKVFRQITFIPATKINPTIKSNLKHEENGIIHYGYSLISGRDSQQVIIGILIDPVSSVTTTLPDIHLNVVPAESAAIDLTAIEKTTIDMLNAAKQFDTPHLWQATMTDSKGSTSFRIGWYYDSDTGGLTPGGKADFGFNSRDLPSIIQAEISGYAPDSQEIPGEETQNAQDGGFGQQYENLTGNNFLLRNVAVPTIAVPTPFNAAVLLDRIQTQMHKWIAMSLLDATFSAQFDRYFQSAINAYRLNQPKVGKQQIETMLALIKKEQPSADTGESDNEDGNKTKLVLIDKLAASVLDFDLDYVMQRMEKEEGEHAATGNQNSESHQSKPQRKR